MAAYVSKGHVDHPEIGCILAALGTEARTQKSAVRRAFSRAARGFVDLVDLALGGKSRRGAPSDEALATAARMIGAVILARMVQDAALAERILEAAREDYTARAQHSKERP